MPPHDVPTSPRRRLGRTERLLLRVTPEEKAVIARNSAELGLGMSAFLRAAGLGYKASPRRPLADDETIYQLARIGNNLNQLAKQANSGGIVGADALSEALAALMAAVRRLE